LAVGPCAWMESSNRKLPFTSFFLELRDVQ